MPPCRLIVDMVGAGRRPSDIMTRESFLNAIIAVAAIGGSTNSVVHLLAIAGRLGIDLTLEDFDAAGAGVPVLANLQPSGTFLMDDLYRAGGVLALPSQVQDLLHPEPKTVTGKPLVDYLVDRPVYDPCVISPRDAPLMEDAGIAVLRGNLAPRGAIIKPAAAAPVLHQHVGPAVVFDSVPEVGNIPLPRKLLEQGVCDMVRISDARMSGTAYGTVILHVAPEAAAGGPLAFIRTGDVVTIDVENRILSFDLTDAELQPRGQSTASAAAYAAPTRGRAKLYVDHMMQADTGADLDFLIGASGDEVSRESH